MALTSYDFRVSEPDPSPEVLLVPRDGFSLSTARRFLRSTNYTLEPGSSWWGNTPDIRFEFTRTGPMVKKDGTEYASRIVGAVPVTDVPPDIRAALILAFHERVNYQHMLLNRLAHAFDTQENHA